MKILVIGTAGFIGHHLAPTKPFDTSGRAELKLSEVPVLGELLKTPSPFALSKLFTRRLKGGIEKQGSGVVGWFLPPQLWGKEPAN